MFGNQVAVMQPDLFPFIKKLSLIASWKKKKSKNIFFLDNLKKYSIFVSER